MTTKSGSQPDPNHSRLCSYAGTECGTPSQLCGPDRVCPKHWRRMQRYGTYELRCRLSDTECSAGGRLYDGLCRFHKFYASAAPCREEGCNARPSINSNKFVGGRCPTHDQRHRALRKRVAAPTSCRHDDGCGRSKKLYNGLCRRHWEYENRFGSLKPPVCAEENCDLTPLTDPGRAFKAGRCNLHYLRHYRANERKSSLGERRCPVCEKDMSFARRNAKHCSVKCTQSVSATKNAEALRLRRRLFGAQRKAAKLGNHGSKQFSIPDVLAKFAALEFRCTYCGTQCSMDSLHIDHIVPLKKGGPHNLENVTPACSGCNCSKHARLLLAGWAPLILGGKPRWDRTAPRGQKGNPWVETDWRTVDGPLPHLLERASLHPELLRAILVTELFLRARGTAEE